MSGYIAAERDSGKWLRGFIGLGVATAINHAGDRVLGVTIEIFTYPIQYFSMSWVLDVFFVPLLANFVLALIFGKGSKWLCYLTPLIVRGLSYYNIAEITGPPSHGHLIPMGWWGFMVILAMETGMVGAIIGESIVKRNYGRKPVEMLYEERLQREEERREKIRQARARLGQ